jgi:hypothetical protein
MYRGVITRAPNNVHYIALDARLDPHISYFSATPGNRVGIRQGMNLD